MEIEKPERVRWSNTILETLNLENVSLLSCLYSKKLTVSLANTLKVKYLVRGVRDSSDAEKEKDLAFNNRILSPDIRTVLIPTSQEYSHVSSSAVRQIIQCLQNNDDHLRNILSSYLPDAILDEVILNKDLFV